MAISYYDQCGNCEYYEFEGKDCNDFAIKGSRRNNSWWKYTGF